MATTVHSERVWKVEFLKYFQKFLGDTWFLCKCNEKDPVPERWRRFRDSAKVRFCCETCSNGWTSMKGRIVFWFYLDYRTRVGYCLFKLYGQKCKKCNKNLTFEAPMWYPEEINKVICNVYNRIGEVYYNFSKATLLVDRRDGRPRLQHNRDLCQACLTGECWNGPGDIINAETDTLNVDLGKVNWQKGKMFTMQVRMLVAKHDKFTPGCCYWFAAAIKYSNGEEIWTSQLGIELEMLPLNEDEFVFEVSDSPLAFPRLNGGGGSQKVVVIFPYSSVSAFKLKAEIKPAYRSKLCMCNIGILYFDDAFLGCKGTEFPFHDIFMSPPYNDTLCKEAVTIDFGPLTKVSAGGPLDEIHFIVSFRTRNSDFGITMSEFIQYTVDSEGDRPTITQDSSTTRVTGWGGSLDKIKSIDLDFNHVGLTVGTSFAASAFFLPVQDTESENGYHVTLEMYFPNGTLTDLRAVMVLEEVGSSCVPLETKFYVENVNENIQRVRGDWIPISVSQFELARFKLSFLATVVKPFEEQTFELIAKVDGEKCWNCPKKATFGTTQSVFYQVDRDTAPTIRLKDPYAAVGSAEDESLVYAKGWGILKLYVNFPPAVNLVYRNAKVSFTFNLGTNESLSALTFERIELVHVGDNMPTLQYNRDSYIGQLNGFTDSNFDLVHNIASMHFDTISFLSLNTEDTRDSQMVISLSFRLKEATFIDAAWEQTIYASLTIDNKIDLSEYMTVLAMSDPDTAVVLELGSVPEDVMEEVFDAGDNNKGIVPEEDPSNVGETNIKILPGQTAVIETKFYIRPVRHFNEFYMKYEIAVTDSPGSAEICTTEVFGGKNVILDTIAKTATNGEVKISNKGSYENETEFDYQLHLYHKIKAPDASAASVGATLDIAVTFLPYLQTGGPYEELVGPVEHRSIVIDKTLLNEWSAELNLFGFKIEDMLHTRLIQPMPGGSFAMPLDIYIPPRTLGTYQLTVSTYDGLYVHTMHAVRFGDNLSPGCYDITQDVSLDGPARSFDGIKLIRSSQTMTFGYITNIDPIKRQSLDEILIDDNTIKVDVELATVDGEANFGDSYTVDFYLTSTDDPNFVFAEWHVTVDFKDRPVSPGGFPGDLVETTFKRNFALANEIPEVQSGFDYQFEVEIKFHSGYNYDTCLTVESDISNNMGSEFVLRKVEIISWGSNIEASMVYDTPYDITRVSFESDFPARQIQENRMQYCMGRITKLDSREGLGTLSTSNEENMLKLRVTVMMQDEIGVTENTTIYLHWALEAHDLIISSGQVPFKAVYAPTRTPFVETKVTVLNVLEREYEQGDIIWYEVELFTACNATAEAVDLEIRQFLPDYFVYEAYDAVRYTNRWPHLDTSDSHVMLFILPYLKLTEYIKWTFSLEVVVGHMYFQEIRLYYHFTPFGVLHYKRDRGTDKDHEYTETGPYSYKLKTIEFQSIVRESVCGGNLIHLTDEEKYLQCQFTATSTLHPVTYAPTKVVPADHSIGWKSSTWQGQWEGHQSVTVALLDKWKLARFAFNLDTSVKAMTLQYSTDPEGSFWRYYTQREEIFVFRVNNSFLHSDDGQDTVHYLDIAYPIEANWLKIQFIELDKLNDDGKLAISSFRYNLYGCFLEEHAPSAGIERACPTATVFPEVYDRGFIVDQDKRALYVCEKNLAANKNSCMRMMIHPQTEQPVWSRVSPSIHSIIGYLFAPNYRLFAIGQSMMAYLASDDMGLTWISIQTSEWWTARRQSSQFFSTPIKVKAEFIEPEVTSASRLLKQYWSNVEFVANDKGIWMRYLSEDETNVNSYKFVYSWSKCCS